ncbi:MAG: hypothetical protein ABJF11_02325 [Reichenbachiella sp.]|uniref:hypothetical protein n=1 Tax=Reichenbachiella sp. TaxID=2184521 RepID=UPI003265299A
MRYFLSLIFLYCCILSYAQVVPVQGVALNPIDQSIFSQWASEVDDEVGNQAIVGSPYLLDDWSKGEITTIKGEKHVEVDLKLNLFSDQLIYRNPFTKDSTLILIQYLQSFTLRNKDTTYNFHYVTPKGDSDAKIRPQDFYLILSEGKLSLLARPEVKIKRATKNSMVNSDGQIKDRFSRSAEFFLRNENGRITQIKGSKKALVKSMPAFTEKVAEFVKLNKIDPTEAKDLMAVFKYYNSLE